MLPLVLLMPQCKLGRFVLYNFADINDHKKFKSRPLDASVEPFIFQSLQEEAFLHQLNNERYENFLKNNKTLAFLVIHRDTIVYEKYFDGYDQERIMPAFSMAKSVTSMLIGCVIDDGLIKSINESMTVYVPELSKNGFDKVTIKHLLQMTSGLDFNEGYFNPFG
jgi:CubicO group peptidase (beta-lactamase class C family)